MPCGGDLFYLGSAEDLRRKRAARALEKKGVHPKFARVIARKTVKSIPPRRR